MESYGWRKKLGTWTTDVFWLNPVSLHRSLNMAQHSRHTGSAALGNLCQTLWKRHELLLLATDLPKRTWTKTLPPRLPKAQVLWKDPKWHPSTTFQPIPRSLSSITASPGEHHPAAVIHYTPQPCTSQHTPSSCLLTKSWYRTFPVLCTHRNPFSSCLWAAVKQYRSFIVTNKFYCHFHSVQVRQSTCCIIIM